MMDVVFNLVNDRGEVWDTVTVRADSVQHAADTLPATTPRAVPVPGTLRAYLLSHEDV